jgi:hypothetical protein
MGLHSNCRWVAGILHRLEMRHAATLVEPHPERLLQARMIPAVLHDRCFNCLSYSHRVATCRLPWRCLCYRGFRHLARDCKCPRSASSTNGRAVTYHVTLLVATIHWPPSMCLTVVHARLGPCRVSREASAEPDDDVGDNGASRLGTTRLLTVPTTPLPLLLHTTSVQTR